MHSTDSRTASVTVHRVLVSAVPFYQLSQYLVTPTLLSITLRGHDLHLITTEILIVQAFQPAMKT
jgi:hypothetical protein